MKWSDFQSRGMNAKKSGCPPQTEMKIAVWASVQINCLCCGIPGYHPPDVFFSLLTFRYLGINTKESHFCNICSAFLENSRSMLAKMFLPCDFEVNQKEAIQSSLCLDPAKYLAKRAISSYQMKEAIFQIPLSFIQLFQHYQVVKFVRKNLFKTDSLTF